MRKPLIARDYAMPVLSFKGKSVIETCHHSVPHHTVEFSNCCKALECPYTDRFPVVRR